MACRHKEIEMLEDDKVQMELAIEKLVAALDKSNCVGEDCDYIDTANYKTFRTRNFMRLSNNLKQLNDEGESVITLTIAGMSAGLEALKALLFAYRQEDLLYHATHPNAEIPEESEESA